MQPVRERRRAVQRRNPPGPTAPGPILPAGRAPLFLQVGDTAASVEFGRHLDRATSLRVMRLAQALAALNVDGITEAVPTIRALMIHYDPLRLRARDLRGIINSLIARGDADDAAIAIGTAWRIPVRYGAEHGLDLPDLVDRIGLSEREIVDRHAACTYHAYMIGAFPGHPYLGDTDPMLAVSRRAEPRLAVPAGSIAMAAGMTNIYPFATPGGWHVLGCTPVPVFDPALPSPALIAPGDRVTFTPVDADGFAALRRGFAEGTLDPVAVCRVP